ncbi:alpha-amylase [Ferruginibacter paludis]|uniref:alpha-amylase n=1 Tax=Ferruginibacter paludis TaxID=1310417 RepID=UPI0025B2DF9D|nr:alpha-amylase [Ferruginibacter paludis]MDN3657909.1 alpha-amylase [Ferruginibacter paludis]
MQNSTMIQYFHWYTSDNSLWKEIKEKAPEMAKLGITSAWLPPAYKAAGGGYSTGYDVYDLYDLGEFDQKSTVRTKYGNKEEYLAAVNALQSAGIQVIADVVLNHKAGGDETEKVMAVKVNEEDRNQPLAEPEEIEAYTKFLFPGRKEQYSSFKWDYRCFTGVDYNHATGETAIYSLLNEHGSDWEAMVDDEKGNYDYLMYCDIEFRNAAVREELASWGKWYHDMVAFDGVRLDAVKHISPKFFNEWLVRLRKETGKEIFAVGEYWAPGKLPLLLKYIEMTEGNMSLFDAALHHNLHNASNSGSDFDMRTIFDDSLVKANPLLAVTVVDNHDTQPLQALEAPVEPWFKPIAYALILLRVDGYPCIFYPDLVGCSYTDKGKDGQDYEIFLDKVEGIELLMQARVNNAYGMQRDYFDHANCIGWTREGDDEHHGCAVVCSNGEEGTKMMEIGQRYAGKIFKDILGKHAAEITINETGWAEFYCPAGSVSVWTLTGDK